MITLILLALLVFFTALLFWQFLGYPLFMSLFCKDKSRLSKDYLFKPFISIIVPTYNEERVIKRRIENLVSQNWPKDKFEIIVVDSGSTDSTLDIAKTLVAMHKNVKVMEEGERKGKASAINLGKSNAEGEIALVTDANTLFHEDVLREIAPHFADLKLGAVGGFLNLSNPENALVSSSSFYWNIESIMRRGESNLDSACLFHGEINAWRNNIVEADINALTEDLDMAIQIRRQGYKIAYEPNALAYETGPTSSKEQIIQKKRTTLGTIQSFFKHKRYFWFPHDKYSGFIFPSHKGLQIFSPYLLIGVLAILLALLILGEFTIVIVFLSATATIFLVLLFGLKRKISKIIIAPKLATKTALPRELWNLLYFVLLHEYIILLAWKDFVLKKYSVLWEKAESTR